MDGNEQPNKSEMELHSWLENYSQQRVSVGEKLKTEGWNKVILTITYAIHNLMDFLQEKT